MLDIKITFTYLNFSYWSSNCYSMNIHHYLMNKEKLDPPSQLQMSLHFQRLGISPLPKNQKSFTTKFLLFHLPLPWQLVNYKHLPPYPAFLNRACFMSSEVTSVFCSKHCLHDINEHNETWEQAQPNKEILMLLWYLKN